MPQFDNLSGQEIGLWEVLRFHHMQYNGTNKRHGMSYYECKCKKCGAVRIVARSHLLSNKGHKHEGCGALKKYAKTV